MANVKVYKVQGGDELVIAAGGKITVEDGGAIDGIAAEHVEECVADDVDGCVESINLIRAALIGAGLMKASGR